MSDVLDAVLARFAANGLDTQTPGGSWYGRCPVHRDVWVELVDDIDHVTVQPCPRGCLPEETIRQLGLEAQPPADWTEKRQRVQGKLRTPGDPGQQDPGAYLRLLAVLDAKGMTGRRSDPTGNRGESRHPCPACGAKGDGHGLKIAVGTKGQPVVIHCFNSCEPGEVLAALGVGWGDICRPLDDVTFEWAFEDKLNGTSRSTTGETPVVEPVTLDQAHETFRRWLGDDYDLDALDAMLACLAVERLDGDPPWLLLVSGPGNAKTETVASATGAGAIVESTITGEAALLSGTPTKERRKNATGGLLRRIGDRGVLIIKDVTSIISMNRDRRAEVLAALREVYDGYWSRSIGTDGGLTLTWSGRVVLVGAVTTAWDSAHAVVAACGDRFVLLRMDSTKGRVGSGLNAIRKTGQETEMRAGLAAVVGGVVAGVDVDGTYALGATEMERILAAADVVTLARTGVEYDYRGDVIDAHAPEMPTRFAKQLAQIMRGGLAIGMDRRRALKLALRCARDSMPPLRLAILDDIAANPHSTTPASRKRLGKPRATVDRQLQALHMLGVLVCDELEYGDLGKSRWYYSLADGIDPKALDPESVPDLFPPPPRPDGREGRNESENGAGNGSPGDPLSKSGTDSAAFYDAFDAGHDGTCPDCKHPTDTLAHEINCLAAADPT